MTLYSYFKQILNVLLAEISYILFVERCELDDVVGGLSAMLDSSEAEKKWHSIRQRNQIMNSLHAKMLEVIHAADVSPGDME